MGAGGVMRLIAAVHPHKLEKPDSPEMHDNYALALARQPGRAG